MNSKQYFVLWTRLLLCIRRLLVNILFVWMTLNPNVASSDSLLYKLFKYKQKWFGFTCWKHDVSTCSLFGFLFQFSFNSGSTFLAISVRIRNIFAYQFWFFFLLIECFFKKIHGYHRILLMQFIIISTYFKRLRLLGSVQTGHVCKFFFYVFSNSTYFL